ncbi:MAG: hypothetical protein FWC33_03125 [Candidatus Bathyarchaeota archaeon]|nr:hypothetical protein [Candidatus Termiticorpusculum sp.]
MKYKQVWFWQVNFQLKTVAAVYSWSVSLRFSCLHLSIYAKILETPSSTVGSDSAEGRRLIACFISAVAIVVACLINTAFFAYNSWTLYPCANHASTWVRSTLLTETISPDCFVYSSYSELLQ